MGLCWFASPAMPVCSPTGFHSNPSSAYSSWRGAFSARAEGSTRWAPAGRSGHCLAARLATVLENWKRAVNWQAAIATVGRERLRVHDLRHTYASLSRRAGADLRLLQKAMGHASITVTAHTYADLFDDELDNIAAALDSLSDDLSHRT
jgi:integrase